MLKPTIGLMLHFYPDSTDALFQGYQKPLAAIVTTVWSNICANLTVFATDGSLHARTSVLLHQPDSLQRPTDRFAEWPGSASDAVTAPWPSITEDESLERVFGLRSNAPRVSFDDVNALTRSLEVQTHRFPGTTTTVAIASLPDGFVVGIGQSHCISLENFDAARGREVAAKNALKVAHDNLWEFEGYQLRAQLMQVTGR